MTPAAAVYSTCVIEMSAFQILTLLLRASHRVAVEPPRCPRRGSQPGPQPGPVARCHQAGLCPSYRAKRYALVREGALQSFSPRANMALVRFDSRNGGNNATNMYGWHGQPGLLPSDDDDETGFFSRRQVRGSLPHTSCPLLPGNLQWQECYWAHTSL
jgi:hypothetical protein